MNEAVVAFQNRSGHTLRGVLHRPDGRVPGRNVVVVLVPGGRKVRSGPWRMHVIAARRLASQGIATLRFDFQGLGDSDGEQTHNVLRQDWYAIVEEGGLTDDTVCAARYALAQTGASHVVLAGICGGALNALFASAFVRDVYGHVLIDLPAMLCSAELQEYLDQNPAEWLRDRADTAEETWRGYVRKLVDLHAWRRLLSGESDYALVRESLRQRGVATLERVAASVPTSLVEPLRKAFALPTGDLTARSNPRVAPAFRQAIAAGHRIHFVNSSSESELFTKYFGARELPRDRRDWRGFDLTYVPDSNHSFSGPHAREAVFKAIESMALEADRAAPRRTPIGITSTSYSET